MKNIRAFLSVVLAVSGTCAFAAKDLYVSEDKSYGSDLVPPEQLFDDIQAAINAAVKGDTVWVKDGFVCDSGSTKHGSNRGESRISFEKNITLRGESGDWRTGPIICGRHAATADGRGEDAIRCLYSYYAGKVIGFRLINGAGKADGTAVGGGVWAWSSAELENCLISNCVATVGGGTYQISLKGCTVVDCTATGEWNSYGGGAYGNAGCTATDCVFAGNKSDARGGGTYSVALVNCTVTNNVSDGVGGGVYGGTSLTNCVVAYNTSSTGGGVVGSTAYDCDIYDNTATSKLGGGIYQGNSWKSRIYGNTSGDQGGGVYQGWHVDSVISNNTSVAGGGGCYCVAATNCEIVGNWAKGPSFPSRGGGGYGGTYVNCRVIGNTAFHGGGGLGSYDAETALVAEDCRIEGNFATNSYGGGGVFGLATTRIARCVVTNNVSSGEKGGGISGAGLVIDSTIVGNRAEGQSGGGVASCASVSNCWIAGNAASSGGGASGSTLTRCVLTNNTCTYRGCGFHSSTLYNCRVVDNRKGVSSAAGCGGWDGTCYNCFIANNDAAGFQCWDVVSSLFNCTVTGNGGAGFTTAASNKLRAVNVISWGNGAADKATLVSSNCCLRSGYKVPEGSFNVFSADPRLTPDKNGNLVPKSRRCRNVAGSELPWMTDPADVRSKDLAGNDRIQGSAPDLGCFESKIDGLLLMVR